jgi:YesN/AraC family two-component response regulator
MTGYNSRELELNVRQQGIVYYMLKPFKMNEIKKLLDHISEKVAKGGQGKWQK